MADQQYTGVDTGATTDARAQMDDQRWWKPQAGQGNKRWGDNFIRIMPPHRALDGKLYWGVPLHFSVGPNQTILPCPRKAFQEPCPVCALGFDMLKRASTSKEKEAAEDLLPTWVGYMNVIAIDEDGKPIGDDPQIRLFSASRGIIDDLISILEEKGDFTDLEKGFDINVRKRGSGKKGTNYQTTCAPEPSLFPMPELADGVMDLTKVSQYVDQSVMQAALEGTSAAPDPMLKEAAQPVEAEASEAPKSSRWGEQPSDDEAPAASESDEKRQQAQRSLKDALNQNDGE